MKQASEVSALHRVLPWRGPTLRPLIYPAVTSSSHFDCDGHPKMTTTFSEGDPVNRGLVVLIINGDGPATWRSPTPKSKFVMVNLPYRAISVRKFKLKKRTVEAIFVEEAGDTGDSSAIFFDGKKFRYVPMGGDMQ